MLLPFNRTSNRLKGNQRNCTLEIGYIPSVAGNFYGFFLNEGYLLQIFWKCEVFLSELCLYIQNDTFKIRYYLLKSALNEPLRSDFTWHHSSYQILDLLSLFFFWGPFLWGDIFLTTFYGLYFSHYFYTCYTFQIMLSVWVAIHVLHSRHFLSGVYLTDIWTHHSRGKTNISPQLYHQATTAGLDLVSLVNG